MFSSPCAGFFSCRCSSLRRFDVCDVSVVSDLSSPSAPRSHSASLSWLSRHRAAQRHAPLQRAEHRGEHPGSEVCLLNAQGRLQCTDLQPDLLEGWTERKGRGRHLNLALLVWEEWKRFDFSLWFPRRLPLLSYICC